MRNPRVANTSNAVVKPFENNGLLYGSLLGVLCGVLIAGPHFTDWLIEKIIATIVVSSVVAGITGYLVVSLACGGIAIAPHDDIAEHDDSESDRDCVVDDW